MVTTGPVVLEVLVCLDTYAAWTERSRNGTGKLSTCFRPGTTSASPKGQPDDRPGEPVHATPNVERRGVPYLGLLEVAEGQPIRTAVLAGTAPAIRSARLGPVWSIGPSITGACILYLSPPRWCARNHVDLSLAEAFGSAIATTLVGTVLVALAPLAKSTSYPSF